MDSNEFKKEVNEMAEKIRVKPKEIHLRKMKRKLASCSSKGRLTFDTSLLNESEEERLRVIVHELLHLKYPNHGKMFNRLLDTHLKMEMDLRKNKLHLQPLN
ncbi:MAG: M48 family metallopeptidase [Methanobacterium sp.]